MYFAKSKDLENMAVIPVGGYGAKKKVGSRREELNFINPSSRRYYSIPTTKEEEKKEEEYVVYVRVVGCWGKKVKKKKFNFIPMAQARLKANYRMYI